MTPHPRPAPPRAAERSNVAAQIAKEALADRGLARAIYLAAAKATHPDVAGGDEGAFKDVQSAREVLARHFGTAL